MHRILTNIKVFMHKWKKPILVVVVLVVVVVVVVMGGGGNDDGKSLNVRFLFGFCSQIMPGRFFFSPDSASAGLDVIMYITYTKHSEREEVRHC
jgi:hypothetical protein